MTRKPSPGTSKRARSSHDGQGVGKHKRAEVLREGEERYHSLLENLLDGYAHCKMLFDHNEPRDFIYLEVNKAFEHSTGLKDVVGEKVTDVIPGIRKSNPELFEICGRVVLTGKPERFETYVEPLGRWFSIGVHSTEKEHFVAVFENTTERKQAEAALRESEERYRMIAESVSDAIITIDEDSRVIRFANTTIRTLLGYSPAELLGKEITVVMPERYRDAHRAGMKRYLETGIKHLDWRATRVLGLHKSGKEIPLEVSYSEYATGAKRHVVGVMRDVTKLQQAEEGFRLFRALIDRSNDIVEVVDPDTGRFLDVNEKGCLDLGYSREELLALRVFDVDPTLDQSSFTSAGVGLRHSGVLLWEGLHRRKDGSVFPVEVNISHVQLDREYAVAVVRDITVRKREDAERQATKARLQEVLASSTAVLYVTRVVGDDFVPSWVSENITQMMGYSADEALLPMWWYDHLHSEDRSRVVAELPALMADGHLTMEYRFRHKNGAYLWVHDTARLVRYADERPTEVFGSWLDVTERVELEAQILQAQKMESVGRLAGGIAHDFNNLLTVIIAYAQLRIDDRAADEPHDADLEEILNAGRQAANLTRQLLVFSRRQVLELKVLNLNDVVTGIEKMLRRIIGEDIDLAVALAPDLGAVRVDPGLMEQVIVNLAVNARDAMPKGGKLTIETASTELDDGYARTHLSVAPGPYVLLAVSDTGVGMDEATKTRIFEPFFTTKELGKGTGLGLATVYGIVKQSGGHIFVYSEPDQGTTFKIYLPRVTEPAEALHPGGAGTEVQGGSETILVVEDEADVRTVTRKMLERRGYTILEADGASAALAVADLTRAPPDLLITDVIMPVLSGREVARQLEARWPGLKVLYLSGYTDEAIVRHGVLESGVSFLQKPFTPDALAHKVRHVLDGTA